MPNTIDTKKVKMNESKTKQDQDIKKSSEETGIKLKDVQVKAHAQIVELAAAPERILKQVSLFEELKRKLLSEKDYQTIADKRFIKKSGWRMFALAFNLSDQIIKEERKQYKVGTTEYFAWEVTARVTAPNGRFSEATASCASNEKRFAHAEHDVRATAHTRAKNRAIADLIGGGEVSAEEMEAPGFVPLEDSQNADVRSENELATPKQLSFIKRLASEKGIDKISDATGIKIAENSIPTKKQASEIIDKLMVI